jgi:hypothetical protein
MGSSIGIHAEHTEAQHRLDRDDGGEQEPGKPPRDRQQQQAAQQARQSHGPFLAEHEEGQIGQDGLRGEQPPRVALPQRAAAWDGVPQRQHEQRGRHGRTGRSVPEHDRDPGPRRQEQAEEDRGERPDEPGCHARRPERSRPGTGIMAVLKHPVP